MRLRPTAGAAENLALLREPGGDVDIAFVQGGADATAARSSADDADDRRPGLARQPVPRAGLAVLSRRRGRAAAEGAGRSTASSQLAGWRVNIGAPGSGVPNLMVRLIEANEHRPPGADAAPARRRRRRSSACSTADIDAVVLASAPESLMVQMLLQTPGIRLFDFAQAEAYARRFPFLERR